MFEHKNLDGEVNRLMSAPAAFLGKEILECRDGLVADPKAISRKQYAVVGDLLVERCLPPESIGDVWAHDNIAEAWWTKVMNPPHVGVVAAFNESYGGLHRKPIDIEHNVVAFGADGEEITFSNGIYSLTRKSDGEGLSAANLMELRKLYYA